MTNNLGIEECQQELFLKGEEMDSLGVTALLAFVLLVAGFGCLIVLTLENSASRSLFVSLSVVGGALLAYGIQAVFDLQAPRQLPAQIVAEATIDRRLLDIKQWLYGIRRGENLPATIKPHLELEASNWLRSTHPELLVDRERHNDLFRDFFLYSLLAFIRAELDWQIETHVLRSPTLGKMTVPQRLSKPSECESYNNERLLAVLRRGGNVFGGMERVSSGPICLPPGTEILMKQGSSLTLKAPLVEIVFMLDSQDARHQVVNWEPLKPNDPAEMLDDGPRFYSANLTFHVDVQYSALRAQNRRMPAHQAWASRVIRGAKEWFEGPADPGGFTTFKSPETP